MFPLLILKSLTTGTGSKMPAQTMKIAPASGELPGHGQRGTSSMSKQTVAERFWAKVSKGQPGECWEWAGGKVPEGYGRLALTGGRYVRAHRFAYEELVGPIPDGKVLDHLCRNPSCVNPDHLEPVTDYVNVVERGTGISAVNAQKTHCKNGHEFTPENTYIRPSTNGNRACRACRREVLRACRRRQRVASEKGSDDLA